MAQYPTATYSVSAVSNGDVIDASRDNAQDQELTAVTDALRSGLAHTLTISTGGLTVSTGSVNISGPSSLATLQVNSGSTLAALRVTSTASFASSVTFSGNVTVSGTLTAAAMLPTVPTVMVASESTQALGSTDYIGLSWDTELFDNQGMFSTAANSSRITCAASSGIYLVTACVALSGSVTARPRARLYVNDSSQVAVTLYSTATVGSGEVGHLNLVGFVRAASTATYFTVQVAQVNAGSTMSVLADSSGVTTRLSAHLVSV